MPNKKAMAKVQSYKDVYTSIVNLLELARQNTVRTVNTIITATYWEIGRRIIEFEQKGANRAQYGSNLIEKLAEDLSSRFGRGFGIDNLELMRLFYLEYPPNRISESLIRKLDKTTSKKRTKKNKLLFRAFTTEELSIVFPLSWTHYVRLLRRCTISKERQFYEKEALRGGWSVRTLERQINSQFYQRTLLSNHKGLMLKKSNRIHKSEKVAAEYAIKDPFILEFLDLKDEYSESTLEDALIQKLESFLLELGDDFAFIGRQRRLRIEDEWYRVDLLLFNRRLRCLVIIDLKLGKFDHADAGQMNLYLNYAKEHWTHEGENPPVGIILCAQNNKSVAHYALSGLANKVLAAEYKLALPNEDKLIKELERAKKQLGMKYLK